MKAKLVVLAIAEMLCLVIFLSLVNTPFTRRTVMAKTEYLQNPTEENKRRVEAVSNQDRRDLMVQRVIAGMVLFLTTSLLLRTAREIQRIKQKPTDTRL